MIQSTTPDDNDCGPDWLSDALLPKSPRGFPAVRLTPEIERQFRLRDRQISDLRRWLAERDAAETAEPIRCG